MKYSVAVASAMAIAVSAKPTFTNAYWKVEKDVPCKLTFTGCEKGCTIVMMNGPSTNLKYYKTLTSTATDGTFTFTLTDDPTDDYGLKIIDNETDEYNYSSQWSYVGVGTPDQTTTSCETTATAASTKADKTTDVETTASAKVTTLSKHISTTEVVVVSTPAAHNATTPYASKTKGSSTAAGTPHAGTTTGSESESSSTASTVPKSGAERLSSSVALIAGAVAAMAYLN